MNSADAETETTGQQLELFLPYLADLQFRDQREVMERPFFSLSKSKRVKPIDYRSPDGKVFVHVSGNPDYGMATIWDADILIYCASVISDMQRRGKNDIPRQLRIMPYDLLRAIGRDTNGRAYELLGQALDRLTSTTIKTNIRAEERREATFNWLDGWSQTVDSRERSRGMVIDLSNWFYEGVLMTGGVLAIDRGYFELNGGRERWLYRVARKHAGGAGEAGFAISMETLFEKSGAEGAYKRFKFEISKLVAENGLPGIHLELEHRDGRKEPLVRMIRRKDEPTNGSKKRMAKSTSTSPQPEPEADYVDPALLKQITSRAGRRLKTRAEEGFMTQETLDFIRREYPGWDYDYIHDEFKKMITDDPTKVPCDYQAGLIGFVKWFDKENRHKHNL